MKKIVLLTAILLLGISVEAKLVPAGLFGDSMVLQQQSNAAIWGIATPGATVRVSASWGASASCRADADGKWKTAVQTPVAGYKHYTVSISSGSEKITIKDVLVGEVWIASGQSNMEMPMRGFFNCPVENALEYIAAPAAHDRIRMFTVPLVQSYEPLESVESTWKKADADTRKEMSATAYFFALKLNYVLDVPVGIVALPYGGARIESWLPKEVLESYRTEGLTREEVEKIKATYHRPFLMYNGMFCPVKGYTAKGFIWYQGCSNVGHHDEFVERMSRLVSIWREGWGDTDASMPFYQVEIAPYYYGPYDSAALLRQAQHESVKAIPNSGIVVTNDLVEPYEINNIHPAKKKPVGDRLAYLALHRDYGYETVSCYSPEAVRIVNLQDEGAIGVELTNCPNGVDRCKEVVGLEICGSDLKYYPVTSVVYSWEEKLLILRSEFVIKPVHVKYGWGDFKPGNLHNCEGLPVSPFFL